MNLSDYLANVQHAETFSWFLKNKFGYGSWDAPYWFIGMEEGGGCSCGDVINRISSWGPSNDGLEDLREYCARIGEDKWFIGENRQPTWQWLIRLLTAAAPEFRAENAELAFQQHRWGRRGGTSCVVEFSPLPSLGTSVWRYGEWCPQGVFANQLTRRQALWNANGLGATRVASLRERIAQGVRAQTLKWIVFYGKKPEFQVYFEQIAGQQQGGAEIVNPRMTGRMVEVEGAQIRTLFTTHPTARGQRRRRFRWDMADVTQAAAWLNPNGG